MDTNGILEQLKAERAKIDVAIQALEGLSTTSPVSVKPAQTAKATGKRKMQRSPEARAKMAAAQQARWARLKAINGAKPVKKGKKAADKVPF